MGDSCQFRKHIILYLQMVQGEPNKMNEQDLASKHINENDQKWLLKTQQQQKQDIRGKGAEIWRPNTRETQCQKCHWKEPNNLVTQKLKGTGYKTYLVNEESIICKLPGKIHVVHYPYQVCPNRKEKPKIPIDKW